MRSIRLSMLLCVSAISSGCLVLALQPAYDAESVAFDEALVGQWENADEGARAVIERGEWRSYKVIYTDRFATRAFQSNLTKIGSASFLDLTEMRGADPGPFLLPVHGVFRIAVTRDTLTASPLDYAWFMRAMPQKTVGALGTLGSLGGLATLSLAIDDRRNIVMTAPTSEIRRWLARAPDEAFSAPVTYTKQPRSP